MNQNEINQIEFIEKIFKTVDLIRKIFLWIFITIIGLFLICWFTLMFITHKYKGESFNYKNWAITINDDGTITGYNTEYDKVNYIPYNIDSINMLITVDSKRNVKTEETISFNITADELRSVYRNIFYSDNCYDYEADDSYPITPEEDYMSVRLDKEDKWLTGTQVFKINYSYKLKTSPDDDFIQIPLNVPSGKILDKIPINKITFEIKLPENINIQKTEVIGANNNANHKHYDNIIKGEVINTTTKEMLLLDIESSDKIWSEKQ